MCVCELKIVNSPVCGDIPREVEWEGAAPQAAVFCHYHCRIAGAW